MEREVKLYLAQKEVEFSSIPDILYNFKADDITSPAAVKNSYSKTINIPATPNNNKIFGSFYKNDFEGAEGGDLSGVYFDPRKRMPFTITINGALYETGYARLTKITQNKSDYEYQVSLFGGLGDFFYELEYGSDAGKRKLSSLVYDVDDLSFTINADTLYSAWSELKTGESGRRSTSGSRRTAYTENEKFDVINFAPCYDGIPSDFSADKVLVNYSGITADVPKLGYSSVTEDDVTYTTYHNYYLAELPKEYTQAEMREYRSWMQRPVLSVRKTIEAICMPENNGGYTVVLDQDFFNSGNTYYNDAFVTLPLLSEINKSDFSTFDDYTTHTFVRKATLNINGQVYTAQLVFSPAFAANAGKIQMNLELLLQRSTGVNASTLVTSAMIDNPPGSDPSNRNFSGFIVQLRAFGGDSLTSSIIGTSEAVLCTSVIGNGDFLKMEETNATQFLYDASVRYCFGQYDRVSGSVYKWSTPFTLTMDIPSGAKCFGLSFIPVANITTGTSYNGSEYVTYGSRKYKCYTASALTSSTSANTASLNVYYDNNSGASVNGNAYVYTGEGDTMGYTGAFITKNMLLDTDYSPCDFLLSYAKLFGLYFVKDPVEKIIHILTRANFFNRNSITDITDYIDRTSVEITPLSFDHKWYNWGLTAVDSEYENLYNSAYGKKYGDMDVDTGFEFNTEEKKVLNGNIFRSCVEALERSNQFYTVGDDDRSRPWMHNSYTYTLFNSSDMEQTKEISIPKSTTINRANLQEGYNFYDIFSKPVFHKDNNDPVDGKNVLLLYNGKVKVGVMDNYGLKCYITDDVPEMGVLNSNEACWLYTLGGSSRGINVYGYDGGVIAKRITDAPHFSRFTVYSGSSYIARSLDFGVPQTTYTPGIGYTSAATMYSFFWKDYMDEIFSKNSRIMKCKMQITEPPTIDWLRRFYYFDNTLWRMTMIKDWNVTSDKLTDVEFVRVRNITRYTSENPTGYKDIFLSIDNNSIGLGGGTINFHIRTLTPETEWTLSTSSGMTASSTSGTGDYNGTFTISSSASSRTLTATAYSLVYNDIETIIQVN